MRELVAVELAVAQALISSEASADRAIRAAVPADRLSPLFVWRGLVHLLAQRGIRALLLPHSPGKVVVTLASDMASRCKIQIPPESVIECDRSHHGTDSESTTTITWVHICNRISQCEANRLVHLRLVLSAKLAIPNGPQPTAFLARTRNTYSVDGERPSTAHSHSPQSSTTRLQV